MTLRDILKEYNKDVIINKYAGNSKLWDRELDIVGECIEYNYSLSSKGYGRTTYNGKHIIVARLVLSIIYNNYGNGLDTRHLCHNRKCVNPKHLIFGSRVQNSRDSMESNNTKCGREKLTNQQVINLRRLYKTGKYTQEELSKMFNMAQPNICNIVNYKTYLWIR